MGRKKCCFPPASQLGISGQYSIGSVTGDVYRGAIWLTFQDQLLLPTHRIGAMAMKIFQFLGALTTPKLYIVRGRTLLSYLFLFWMVEIVRVLHGQLGLDCDIAVTGRVWQGHLSDSIFFYLDNTVPRAPRASRELAGWPSKGPKEGQGRTACFDFKSGDIVVS